jgi:hypothetical protein
MDPQATWNQFLEAYAVADWELVEELATALKKWLARGGFPPFTTSRSDLGSHFDEQLAQKACAVALDQAQRRKP